MCHAMKRYSLRDLFFFSCLCCPVGVYMHVVCVMNVRLMFCFCCCSVQRSNCYMVCAADAVGPSSSSRSNSDLEIGCLIDLATGLVSFTANGKELPTTYQVNKNNSTIVGPKGLTHKDGLPHKLQCVHAIISFSRGKHTVCASYFFLRLRAITIILRD